MDKIIFEDKGQDFLEWDVHNGVVVHCGPFQERIWRGTKIYNSDIQPGDYLEIETLDGRRGLLKYKVVKVIKDPNQ